MKNIDIREKAAAGGVKLWMVADELGIADYAFSKKLRKELSESEKARVFGVIEKLSREVR